MPARIFKPPTPAPATHRTTVFLAGSIDMGAAEDWQERVEIALSDLPIEVFNPRRDDWDATWTQDISNKNFRQQVEWELDHLDRADYVIVHFDPVGKAPITLMELGLHAESGKCFVCCPAGFWRRGNIQIICKRFGIPLYDDMGELLTTLRSELGAADG